MMMMIWPVANEISVCGSKFTNQYLPAQAVNESSEEILIKYLFAVYSGNVILMVTQSFDWLID